VDGNCDSLTIEVRDRGPGFDVGASRPGGRLGLAGMCERVEIEGGTLDIHSHPGRGTVVRVVLPLVMQEEAHA
jgi:signal transduction histidine kinase